ncbi:4-hydroxy-tetrahydrodipicolinate synthase [Loigolactobacillus backii]|uniref:4-hydroxy-tetrahydrodipicolinate synthase n=1 Tax=Loigolactobacillus backii TaxID=375175 RepID=UPI000C1C8504|nr:4-hydroxy-tetrahydrodipicolinate synthase [Loigolactobacillus backii]PIO83630.1 4-hydroxy-tetrahydrodipicolinate synthase [Loigolactobacillus backii]
MSFLNNVSLVTAMVTPFDDYGQVSYERLATLIDHLLATGTETILVGGTTGEGPTLSASEKLNLFEETVKLVGGRVPIIANTGSNNTAQTIEFTQQVAKIQGIAAALIVVPYYNKPDQRGMYAHYKLVSEQAGLPIIIYNIPGRTGVTMLVKTAIQLSLLPNIIGIKDCTGATNLGQIVEGTKGNDFAVFTGEDEDAFAAKTIGAQGVISVSSHLFGQQIKKMYQLIDENKVAAAAEIMRQLTPKGKQLFAQPSPGPVKAALKQIGIPVGGVRLPLLMPTKAETELLLNILDL